jgi:hypothetical protein
MAAACSTSNATGSTGACASKPWLSSGGAMLFLPNMHWPEASQTLLLSSGTDCRRLSCCLVLLAGNAPWQCQYCQANMQLFSHKSRHDCPFMVAKDYVCIAVALPRILAYIRSVTFRLSVILCCQPCMHHAVLFCRPDKEHATTAQIIALSKQMARDAPSTSFPPAKQRVQLAQRRRAPISM